MNQNNNDVSNYKMAVVLLRVMYIFTAVLCVMFFVDQELMPGMVFGILTVTIVLICNAMKKMQRKLQQIVTNKSPNELPYQEKMTSYKKSIEK